LKNPDSASAPSIPALPRERPLLVGLRAARANLVPGIVIQVAMIALVVAYHSSEPTRIALGWLEELKQSWGYLFSFVAGAVAGGLLPEFLLIGLTQRWRVRRENFANAGFHILLWGGESVVVDALYRLQGHLFGTGGDVATIVTKMAVDQFIYCPLFATPVSILIYEWRNRGYRLDGFSGLLTPRFYKEKICPSLVANWGVWIPLVCVIYSMPPQLQIPLFSLALTFWVILFAWINRPK